MNVARRSAIAVPQGHDVGGGYPPQKLFERLNNVLTAAPVEITMKHKHARFTLNNRAVRAQRRELIGCEKTHAVFYANVSHRRRWAVQASPDFKRHKVNEHPAEGETRC